MPVQVDSSVAQDAFSDEDRSTGTDTRSSDAPAVSAPPNAWKKPPVSDGVSEAWPEQPIALPTAPASKRKAEAASRDTDAKAQQGTQPRKEGQKAETARKDKQPVQEPKEQEPPGAALGSQEGVSSQLPGPPVAPKTPALSWRKILAGNVHCCSRRTYTDYRLQMLTDTVRCCLLSEASCSYLFSQSILVCR